MPNFESPIGKKKFASNTMREFDVPDESGYADPAQAQFYQNVNEASIRDFQARDPFMEAQRSEAEIEKEIRAAREAKRTGKERLSDGAKRRIEMLLGMTRVTREVDINGNIFVLRTLKSKEMSDAIFEVSKFDGTTQGAYEIRRQLLSRSLTHVAGVEIESFISSNALEGKLAFIDELDDPVITRLYSEYITLVNEAKSKYAPKNDQEVKEVLEDLKK